MNSIDKNLNIQTGYTVCSIHHSQMARVCGRDVCRQCAEDVIQKTHAQHAAEMFERIRQLHYAGSHIPTRYRDSGFRNFHCKTQGQREALMKCAKFSNAFAQHYAPTNLVMTGRTGTGKTHLACAMIRNVLSFGKFARYVTSADMADAIAGAWKKTDDSEAAAVLRFAEYDMLVIDEYGLDDQHESRLKLIHKVLYARYEAKKPTVIISNMGFGELKQNLGDRLWSRLQHDGLTAIECNWADARINA